MPQNGSLRIFLSAGEASGDLHAAYLVRALREAAGAGGGVEVVGVGGERMAAEGVELIEDVVGRAAMWGAAFGQIRHFLGILDRVRARFKARRPDAVVMIDFPGFHFPLARAAKAARIPVLWYIPPQLWAWGQWRVRKLRRRVTRVACVFPFEPAFYRRFGVPAEFVGHPLLDVLADRERAAGGWRREDLAEGRPLVGLLPGSRHQEIEHLLPTMLQVAVAIRGQHPFAGLVIAAAKESHLDLIRRIQAAAGLRVPIVLGRTYDVMAAADLCLASTGTATVELMMMGTPTVALYQVSPLARHVTGRLLLRSKYIAMPNVLARRRIIPEFLLTPGQADRVIPQTLSLLANPQRLAAVRADLAAVKATLGNGGAPRRTAEIVLQMAGRGL